MLWVYSWNVRECCMSHCSGLFCCMAKETMIWREKGKFRIRAVQMDRIRGLLDIRRIDSVLNSQIRDMCRVMKEVDKRIDEGVL